jgi:hypothetical protein
MIHHLPKQLLGHLGGSLPVGVGKPVAAGCPRTANVNQRTRVQLEGITHVIQADAMGQLRIAIALKNPLFLERDKREQKTSENLTR